MHKNLKLLLHILFITHWEIFFWKSNSKKTWSRYVYYPYLRFARFLWFFTLKMIYMFSKIFHIFKVCPNNVYISFKMCTTFTNSIWIFLIINPRLYNVQFRGTLNIIATLLFKKSFSLSDFKSLKVYTLFTNYLPQ